VLFSCSLNIVIFLGKCPGIVHRKLPCQQTREKHPMGYCSPSLVFKVSLIEELSKSDASMQAARDCGIWRREIGEKIQYEIYLPVDVKSDRTKDCLETIASTFEGFLTDVTPLLAMIKLREVG
jgi:hypothetical protein